MEATKLSINLWMHEQIDTYLYSGIQVIYWNKQQTTDNMQ